jgi:hypothetical protein
VIDPRGLSAVGSDHDADDLAVRDRLSRLDRKLGDDTRPVLSFSIFIASTMQITSPGCTSSPSPTFTASTVPCIGVTTASFAPAWAPP